MRQAFPFPTAAALLLAGAVALTGCTASGGQGDVTMSVKDAPADYQSILVTFTEVRVHKDGEWKSVFNGTKTVDLLKLNASTAREELFTAKLDEGNYSKLWITVKEAKGVKNDNSTVTFKVPSGTLKIQYGFRVNAGGDLEIVLDFDLGRAIVERGSGQGSGERDLIFKPVLKRVTSSASDSDKDGKDDVADADDDNDGTPDAQDDDADGDGTADESEVREEA